MPGKSMLGSIRRSTSTPAPYGPRSWGKGNRSSLALVSNVARTVSLCSEVSCDGDWSLVEIYISWSRIFCS